MSKPLSFIGFKFGYQILMFEDSASRVSSVSPKVKKNIGGDTKIPMCINLYWWRCQNPSPTLHCQSRNSKITFYLRTLQCFLLSWYMKSRTLSIQHPYIPTISPSYFTTIINLCLCCSVCAVYLTEQKTPTPIWGHEKYKEVND